MLERKKAVAGGGTHATARLTAVSDESNTALAGGQSSFQFDGQKLPVSWRQLNCACVLGSKGVPSALRTCSRNASFAMAPPRGSAMVGHMIQGKPCEPSKARV